MKTSASFRECFKIAAKIGSVAALAAVSAWAQNPAKAPSEPANHAVLVLRSRCLPCHSGASKRSGLDLATRESILRGGDRGPGIVPGDPENSLVYQVVAHKVDPHMPYKSDKLPEDVIGEIAAWIKAGAPYGSTLEAAPPPTLSAIESAARKHWAFQPVKPVPIPKVKNTEWVRNPIDSFIAAAHEERGLRPSPAAGKSILLRRVYLDVVGIPPTLKETEAFLADRSPDAYEKVVDRLLAHPGYGERWGRHWMDIWRYSDWYGWRKQNEVRNSQRHIWQWRDWIIDSLNEDKGYDRLIVEMLAGDEVAPSDPKIVRATGYLARDWEKFSHNSWLQNAVDHTATGFLGISLKCARCHDHKYDPFSQEEYYRMRAFFEPYDVRVDRVPGEPDTEKNGLAHAFDATIDAATFRFIRGNEDNPEKDKPLAPGTPAILGGAIHIAPVTIPFEVAYPNFRAFVHKDLLAQAKSDIAKAEAELAKANDELTAAQTSETVPGSEAAGKQNKAKAKVELAKLVLQSARTRLPALEARIAADKAKFAKPAAPDAEALAATARKAEYTANLAKVQEALLRVDQLVHDPAVLADPDDKEVQKKLAEARKQVKSAEEALEARVDYTPVGAIYPESSTGRRLALARWIANRQNPLTARVAVNDIWLRHFGSALVPSVDNFGLNGKAPSNPALLDWLAMEFMDENWSMKKIHRLILTSNTYRMQSGAATESEKDVAIDPDNVYFWRMNPRRMEAEVVRDSLLAVAGELDGTMHGPELNEDAGQTSHRRSIYFRQAPDLEMTFLKIFDGPNPIECYMRGESVVPQQALALVNSKLSAEMAAAVTSKSMRAGRGESNESFAKAAFETVLGRLPRAEELRECITFLHSQTELLDRPASLTAWREPKTGSDQPSGAAQASASGLQRARQDLVQALFSHNDFVTVR